MGFPLSKIFWALAAPTTLLLLALILGVVALWLPWPSVQIFGRWLLSVVVVLFLGVSLFPLERLVLTPLERHFPQPVLPDRVDGIIVLGGGLTFVETPDGEVAEPNESGERLTALLALAQRYPEAKLVFTGGSGSLSHPERREADAVAPLLANLGMRADRLLVDREARNTRENAVQAKALAQPQPGEIWLLVTSAFHMPRAVGCFRAVGWPVTAYPVDYLTHPRGWLDFDLDPLYGLYALNMGVREWLGLVAYRLLGWTDELLPAP